MSILQDKKWPVVFALIVMIVGSILYFTMDIPRAESMKEKDDVMNDTKTQYDDGLSSNPNIPMIENEAII